MERARPVKTSHRTQARPRVVRGAGLPVLALIYACSGGVALLYEVVWTRVLTLDLGHTVAAASTVLAAFMGGLAAGAALAGRRTASWPPSQALRVYASLEIAIAACAVALPWSLDATRPLLAALYGETGSATFAIARILLALAIVGIPAAAMGATYPLLVRATDRSSHSAAVLYATNTLGAGAGALLTGFLLLPWFGTLRTSMVGALVNATIAMLAWRLSARNFPEATPTPRSRVATSRSSPTPTRADVGPTIVVLVSGATALALEIVWTRALALVMGPTTYAFSAMLASFIIGLAGGAWLGSWIARRASVPLSSASLALAVATLASAIAASRLEPALLSVARAAAAADATFSGLLRLEIAIAFAMLAPLAACFGAVFPLALAAVRGADMSWHAGTLYAWNTVGAIGGSLSAGFWLIPRLGLQGTLRAITIAIGVAAAGVALRHLRQSPAGTIGAIVLAVAGSTAVWQHNWDPRLLSSGGYKYAPYLTEFDLDVLLRAGTLRYYREGASGTVAVRDLAGTRTLSIDGKVDASDGGDMLTQRLLAHVPLLFHGEAQAVAIVGLGSGVTLGSALTHPIQRADVIEISPQVIEAAAHFADRHGNALADPRTRILVGDARTHFRLGRQRYDVVISEPSNPWMAGVAALFTREFFLSLRESLSPGGLVCQWTHTYDLSRDDLRSIVGTFASVFPDVMLWLVGDGDLLMIGSTRPVRASMQQLARRFARPPVARDLREVGVTTPAVLATLALGGSELARSWSAGAEWQTDDRMRLEFSAPVLTIGRSKADNSQELLSMAQWTGLAAASPEVGLAATLRDAALMHLQANATRRAWELARRAVETDPADPAALRAMTRAAGGAGHARDAEERLRALIAARPSLVSPRLELAHLLASAGRYDEARRQTMEAAGLAPDDLRVLEQQASIAADAGDVAALEDAVKRLRLHAPASPATLYYTGTLALANGRATEAVEAARAATTRGGDFRAWNLLGAALASAGAPRDQVTASFRGAAASAPRDPTAYVNLGLAALQAGDATEASAWFAEALTIDPGNAAARRGFAVARPAGMNPSF